MKFRVKRRGQARRHRGRVFADMIAPPMRIVDPCCAASNSFIALMRAPAPGRGPTDTIHHGLAFAVLEDAAAYFGVSPERLRTVVGLPTTVAHTGNERNVTLDASVSKRLRGLAEVALMAADVFEDEEAARIWLCTENRAFPAPAPLDFLATERGTAAVYTVLNAVSTGGAA